MNNQNIETINIKFNKIFIVMVNYIATKDPSSFFGTYNQFILDYVKNDPTGPLTLFINNIYSNDEYRIKIKNGDDSFFMNQSFDIDKNNNALIKQIFDFKQLWLSLDDICKSYIKNIMLKLTIISESYINLLCDINNL